MEEQQPEERASPWGQRMVRAITNEDPEVTTMNAVLFIACVHAFYLLYMIFKIMRDLVCAV